VGDRKGRALTSAPDRPAFYATGPGAGRLRDWVSLLHPPYTAWHLSYVAIGAALAPHFVGWGLAGTLAAFFLAVGLGAHALDELAGRPLQTGIPSWLLATVAGVGIGVPGLIGLIYGGLRMLPFVVVGAVLAVGYNLEIGGGVLHNGVVFAAAWGAFPVLTGNYAQDFALSASAVLAAAAAFFLSLAQHALSTPARELRRRTLMVQGQIQHRDGTRTELDRATLLAPLETTLRMLACALVILAAALVANRV